MVKVIRQLLDLLIVMFAKREFTYLAVGNSQLMIAYDSGVLNDFFAFNPVDMAWTNLSGLVSGTPPSPRHNFGFASAGGKIFVFGGENVYG